MSTYTSQLRWVVEQALDDKGLAHTEDNWPQVYADLGLNDYPLFSELYRKELNNKIIRHFYMREIGQETFGLFKFMLRRTLFEVMPLHNQMYESQLLEIDPLNEWKMVVTDDTEGAYTNENASSATRNTSSNSRNVFQDTPQSKLNLIGSHSVENLDYATNVTYDNNTGNATDADSSTSTGSSTSNKDRSETGHHKSESQLLTQWRKTFLNIDMDVIKDLEPCFFGLY